MDGTVDIYSMSDKTEKINRNTRKERIDLIRDGGDPEEEWK